MQENAFRTCTARIPQVAERLGVVPRPSERRCRSGPQGRGRERPPYSACLIRHRRGLGCTLPSQPSPGVAPGPSIPCGKAKRHAWTRTPGRVRPDRGPGLGSTAALVGEQVIPRLEAALDTLPGRIAGAGATLRGRRRGCASTPGLEPVPGPRTGGSLRSRPERPVRHGRTGRRGRKTLPRQRINGKAGAQRRTAKVRIDPPCRLRAQVRLQVGARTTLQPDSGEPNLLPGAAAMLRPHAVGIQTGFQDETALRGSDDGGQAAVSPRLVGPTGRTIHGRHYGVGGGRVSAGQPPRCGARGA